MQHIITLQALSPINHGDTSNIGNGSNIRLFMRQTQIVNGRALKVPSISENALRSVLFRYPLHDKLLKQLDIKQGELPQSVMNLLFSGGNMGQGAKSPGDEITLGHAIKAMYPSLDLLGGAVDNFILPKSRLKLSAWIVCRENQLAIDALAPQYSDEAKGISAFDLVGEETRTRGTGAESEGNQMLYTYETLAAGSKVVIELSLDPHTPDKTAATLAYALKAWNGFIGGQGRQGRGRMLLLKDHNLPDAQAYIDHIAEQKEVMSDGLKTGDFATGKVQCKT